MKEVIIELIQTYGIEAVLLAIIINFLTGIIKMPIKKAARKFEDSKKITRFIVFLPIIIGFFITALYFEYFEKSFIFDKEFIETWLTSTSLSLTFYAIIEKFLPKKNITSGKEKLGVADDIVSNLSNPELIQSENNKKIILKGNKY